MSRGSTGWRARNPARSRSRASSPRSGPDAIATILLAAAGVLLLAGVTDGIYVVIPTVIAAITGGVASAWLFLTRITP